MPFLNLPVYCFDALPEKRNAVRDNFGQDFSAFDRIRQNIISNAVRFIRLIEILVRTSGLFRKGIGRHNLSSGKFVNMFCGIVRTL
jgi:hypothetical protein